MAAAATILDLRKVLAERFPQKSAVPNSVLPTGLRFFDETLVGGLPKSAITELISPHRSAGSASLIHALLRLAQRDRHFVALIDGSDSFDPWSFAGSSFSNLLWVRCRKIFEAIKAADFLLRDGNFPLVIVDLILNTVEELRKIPQTNWYRLQRLVENTASACLILSRRSMVSSAQLKIVLENSWTLKNLEQEKSAALPFHFRIQRSHLRSETGGRKLEAG